MTDENIPSDDEGREESGAGEESEATEEKLKRVEAALSLLLDHMQTSTKGSEILEAEQSRSLLSSIALGLSAVSLLALWSIALAREDIELNLMRFTVGMALLLLASVTDVSSAPLLRRAINRAILEKDPSSLVLAPRSWRNWFRREFWITVKQQSPDFYHHQLARCTALCVYIVAGGFLVWAVFTLD